MEKRKLLAKSQHRSIWASGYPFTSRNSPIAAINSLRNEKNFARVRILHFRSRREPSDIDIFARREWTLHDVRLVREPEFRRENRPWRHRAVGAAGVGVGIGGATSGAGVVGLGAFGLKGCCSGGYGAGWS